MPEELKVKTYGKSELHRILKNDLGVNISYPTFLKLMYNSLQYDDVKKLDFKNRRIIYPSEIKLLKSYYFEQNRDF